MALASGASSLTRFTSYMRPAYRGSYIYAVETQYLEREYRTLVLAMDKGSVRRRTKIRILNALATHPLDASRIY